MAMNSEALYPVLNQVTDWPATGEELATRANEVAAGPEVVEFFESIRGDSLFENEGEVLSMAAQIDDPELIAGEAETEDDTGIL